MAAVASFGSTPEETSAAQEPKQSLSDKVHNISNTAQVAKKAFDLFSEGAGMGGGAAAGEAGAAEGIAATAARLAPLLAL